MRYLQRDDRSAPHAALAWLSAGIIAAGIALRAWQLFGRAALWTDEAALANNIVSRSLGQLLFAPLDHNQAAPVGFLLVEKLSTLLFGNGELALRAFPFICGVASLLLLHRVARRLVSESIVPFVLALFAFAPPLIFFACEVKQYSSDVAIALGLLLLALELESEPLTARRVITAGTAGMVAVWFSQPAVLMEAGMGTALVVFAMTTGGERSRAPIGAVLSAWTVGVLAAVLVSVNHLAPAEWRFMHRFWADGFWPLSLGHPASWAWPIIRIANTLGGLLALPKVAAFTGAALAMLGAWTAWRRDRRTAMLIVAPVIVTLIASAAQFYPFKERLALFLVPLLLLLVAGGVGAVVSVLRSAHIGRAVIAAATAIVFLLDARALHAAPPVYRREEITPAMEFLRRNAHPADRGYVYYGAEPAFRYYAARDGLGGASYLIGHCHRDTPRDYLRELDTLRGEPRAWVLFAHELPRLRERALMLRYLDAIGNARDSVVATGWDLEGKPTRVDLYFYDLSDTARLSRVDATTFQIPSVNVTLEDRFRCQSQTP